MEKCRINRGCATTGKLTRGLCTKHYQRWRKNGDPLVSKIDRDQTGKPCNFPGCEKSSGYKGFCQNHYVMERKLGATSEARRKAREINPLSDTDTAYIAGMVDADGMVTITKQGVPMVCVTNSDLALIAWLKDVIGSGCAYEQKSVPQRSDQDRSRWRVVHRYQLTGGKAQSLLERLRPYMKVKGPRADLAIAVPTRGRDYLSRKAADHDQRVAALVSEVRQLNARGLHC